MHEYTTISYPRSGSHFIRAALRKYKGFEVIEPAKKHAKTTLNITQEELAWFKRHNTIYIVRDVRDAIVSLYYWMKYIHDNYPERYDYFSDYIFPDFLRGKTKLRHKDKVLTQQLIDNPVKYWVNHIEWTNQDWLYDIIKYEDALKQWKIKELIFGCKNSKGIKGRWKEYFSNEDLDYLWDIAGQTMIKLGYKK